MRRARARHGHDDGRNTSVTRKLAKWLSLGIGGLLLMTLLAAALLYWRLQQGPMRLPLLEPHVRAALRDSLRGAGLDVAFRDVVLEIDQRRRLPTLRLRDISLRRQGNELASAPRAAVALGGRDLLHGRLRVRHLELVGTRLIWRRSATGAFSLGIAGAPPAAAGQAASPPAPRQAGNVQGEKKDATAQDGKAVARNVLQQLRRMLAGEKGQGNASLGALETLRVRDADITYVDEGLGVSWHARRADMLLRRVPYGFAMLAKARVEGAADRPLPVELGATWALASGRVSLSVRMQDAELASLMRGLWGDRVDVRGLRQPFSARLGLELTADGGVRKGTAEVLLARGHVQPPSWLARPVEVREGTLRLDYRPEGNEVIIRQGDVHLSAGHLALAGVMHLLWNGEGVPALGLDVRLRQAGHAVAGMPLRRVSLKGVLRFAPLSLNMEDLQASGGGAALRVRGTIRREAEGAGIYVSGRARAISHRLLKELWPPTIGRGARQWLRQHVSAGVIPAASLRLAIPARVMKAAVERDLPMPDKVADVRFSVRGVRFTHVDGWPPVSDAEGSGVMTGNHFRLTLNKGFSRLPSGKLLKLEKGEIRTRDLAARVSPGEIDVRARGAASGFLELADLPPLKLRSAANLPDGSLRGKALLRVRLAMPFSRDMRAADIRIIEGRADVRQAEISGLAKGLDLKQGTLRIVYEKGMLRASGDARMAGLPVKLVFRHALGSKGGGADSLRLKARLGEAEQRRLGVSLAPWLTGPVPVEAEATLRKGRVSSLKVRASLDRVAMSLPAIGWNRAPRKGTQAAFDVLMEDNGAVRVRNLRLTGPGGLRVQGRLNLDAHGAFTDATFSRFELDANNRLALGLEREKNGLNVAAAGPSFDARPLITRLFAPRRRIDRSLRSVFVRVNITSVQALRGEKVNDVRGEITLRDGLVRRASLTGRFASGRKVALDLAPARDGLRRLRIVSDDAGALLRASGLYSRILGGSAEFTALLKGGEDGGVQRGLLILRKFMVRGDQRLARLQRPGKKGRAGPRRGQRFKKLVLPFSTDRHFIRIGDAIIRSPEIGATANGMIRRADGAMDIGGTIIPAYALNAAFGKIPVLGALLTGGRGQGVFGMNYALKGTMSRPKFLVNPLSAVAPGVFRQLFHLGGQNVNPDGTPRRPGQNRPRRKRRRNNLVNGRG